MNALTLSQQIICSLSITIVGLFAGIMLGVAMTQQAAQQLSGECWTARQNCSDRLFRKVMPFAFVLTIVSLIAASVVLTDAARVWMGMSCFAFLLVIAITFAVEVPLNNRFQLWEPGKIPGDWQLMRDAWLRGHWWRTVCGIAAFVFSIASCSTHQT
jgi:hypothetical protein